MITVLFVLNLHSGMVCAFENLETEEVEFNSLGDADLLQYIQDRIYSDLEGYLDSDDYVVNDVSAVFVSKEYLEELDYNSKTNVFFGYSLSDIEEQFKDTRYVFTVNKNGETEVQELQSFEDHTFETIIKNLAIGGGVILVCVTVSVVTAGAGAPAISAVFAASAKMGTELALYSGIFGSVSAGIVTGLETHNIESAVSAAAVAGSEGVKWGAITGAIVGGASKAISLRNQNIKPKPTNDTKPVNVKDQEVPQHVPDGKEEVSSLAAGTNLTDEAAASVGTIPTPREAEIAALEKYGGSEQISFLGGEEVSYFTPGATRPDVVVTKPNGLIEAIEVKNYNLEGAANRLTLKKELIRQISSRIENLPPGSTQRIVLNVQGRNYTKSFVDETINWISDFLFDIYPNIPIDYMGAVI